MRFSRCVLAQILDIENGTSKQWLTNQLNHSLFWMQLKNISVWSAHLPSSYLPQFSNNSKTHSGNFEINFETLSFISPASCRTLNEDVSLERNIVFSKRNKCATFTSHIKVIPRFVEIINKTTKRLICATFVPGNTCFIQKQFLVLRWDCATLHASVSLQRYFNITPL